MKRQFLALICAALAVAVAACAPVEPRPAGSSRFISFSVTPVYPRSFDITASSLHSMWGHFGVEEMKDAWYQKARQVAKGHRFKVSSLVVHDSEINPVSFSSKARRITGTITLIE